MLPPERPESSRPPAAPGPALSAPAEPRRERNAAATQKRLLDAAEREFAARGFAGARLREIADVAGVQPALIHHYFVDKQGLYRAVLDRALLPTSTESWTILGSKKDLEGLATAFVDMLVPFYAEHANLLAILRHEAVSGSAVLAEICETRARPIIAAVTAFLEERQRAGEVRSDVTAGEIVLSCMSMVVYPFVDAGVLGVMMPELAGRQEATLERRKKAIVALLLGGIRTQTSLSSK
jgi:TetR/AcrR family transcriptional regulator